MKKLNSLILNSTVNFLDFIYSGRSLQRFWVLEVIARSPYFAFLSVLHFKESLGIKNEKIFFNYKKIKFPFLLDLPIPSLLIIDLMFLYQNA